MTPQDHARAVRARLLRPPNSVPDRGFTDGKYIAAARAQIRAQEEALKQYVVAIKETARVKKFGKLEIVICAVAAHFKIGRHLIERLHGSDRRSLPRLIAIYLVKKHVPTMSYQDIADAFGLAWRDTASDCCKKVEKLMATRPGVERIVSKIELRIEPPK